jgi:16S rRNA processing protein RimM
VRVIAKIIGTHGIKGELKLLPLFDDIDLLTQIDTVWIESKNYSIQSYRYHKNYLLIKLLGFDDINAVDNLSGYIMAEFDDELKEGQYYIEELKGFRVIDKNNHLIGHVDDLSKTTQTLLIIKLDKNFAPKCELLLPFVEEYILEVSMDKSYIKVDINEQIMDLAN